MLKRGLPMLTYFIVLTWWLAADSNNRFAQIPEPVIGVYTSAQSACSDDNMVKKQNPKARSRIWQLTAVTRDCKAVSDPDFMQCLVDDTKFTLKEGTCEPKREFVFKP